MNLHSLCFIRNAIHPADPVSDEAQTTNEALQTETEADEEQNTNEASQTETETDAEAGIIGKDESLLDEQESVMEDEPVIESILTSDAYPIPDPYP